MPIALVSETYPELSCDGGAPAAMGGGDEDSPASMLPALLPDGDIIICAARVPATGRWPQVVHAKLLVAFDAWHTVQRHTVVAAAATPLLPEARRP
jgi:hypothetical protein